MIVMSVKYKGKGMKWKVGSVILQLVCNWQCLDFTVDIDSKGCLSVFDVCVVVDPLALKLVFFCTC